MRCLVDAIAGNDLEHSADIAATRGNPLKNLMNTIITGCCMRSSVVRALSSSH